MKVFAVIRNGYNGEHWADVTVFDNYDAAKEFFEEYIEEQEKNGFYIQNRSGEDESFLFGDNPDWIEVRVEELGVLSSWEKNQTKGE